MTEKEKIIFKLKSEELRIILIAFSIGKICIGIIGLICYYLGIDIFPIFEELTVSFIGLSFGLGELILYLLVHFKHKQRMRIVEND